MSIYVNFDHMIDYLRKVRQSRNINNSPYMDNALLNMQQLLEFDIHNPIIFDYVELGGLRRLRVEWRSASAVFVLPQKQIVERRIYQREGG